MLFRLFAYICGMTNTAIKAELEFDILGKTTTDPIIMPFKKEIMALVEKFAHSGQSGGSAPFTASAISGAVKTLCMQDPLCPITGHEDEWLSQESMYQYQNKRLSSVFKDKRLNKPYYLDAIVFVSQDGNTFTSNGSVKLGNGDGLLSRQFIRLPFTPKTFYVDVIETEWADKEETVKKKGGGWWTSVVKDESQLDQVFEYYIKY